MGCALASLRENVRLEGTSQVSDTVQVYVCF